ncbi:MAG: alpha/beta hydrolase family protein [Gammaproteobacteria bacterium]|nr:alpha/beta hydrolase family protein [Gammaproteobacteria bacterium]
MTARILFVICSFLILPLTQASDMAKEKRWEAQVVDALIVGEGTKLKAGNTEFLAIFAEHTTEKAMGGAIILHGIGVHPAWPEVIQPLRTGLPDHGWATLSLQMPILKNEAQSEDYAPLFDAVPGRIQAGVDYLKKQGIQNIVIVAHSLGASMAAYYLAEKPDAAVTAFVAVGMSVHKSDKKMDSSLHLRKITLPVLDIYGSRDLDQVLKSTKDRATAANKAKNKRYTQLKIEGADHFFNNMDAVLVKRVRGWLAKHAAGTEIKK